MLCWREQISFTKGWQWLWECVCVELETVVGLQGKVLGQDGSRCQSWDSFCGAGHGSLSGQIFTCSLSRTSGGASGCLKEAVTLWKALHLFCLIGFLCDFSFYSSSVTYRDNNTWLTHESAADISVIVIDVVTTCVKYDKFFSKWYINSNQSINKTGAFSFLSSFCCVEEENSVFFNFWSFSVFLRFCWIM